MRFFRIIYIFFSFLVIINTTPVSAGEVSFVSSIFIFSAGMCYDYLTIYKNGENISDQSFQKYVQQGIGGFGVLLSSIYLASCVCIWMGFIYIKDGSTIYTTGNDLWPSVQLMSVQLYQVIIGIFILIGMSEVFIREDIRTSNQSDRSNIPEYTAS